jgi:hypothetical protein
METPAFVGISVPAGRLVERSPKERATMSYGLRFSIDRAIGWDDNITGPWWAAGVATVATLVAFLTLTAGRRRSAVAEARA